MKSVFRRMRIQGKKETFHERYCITYRTGLAVLSGFCIIKEQNGPENPDPQDSEPPEAAEKGGKAWMCCWHLEFFSFLRDLF